LYGNWSGSWAANETRTVIADEQFNFTSITFIPDGATYVWNLNCTDSFGNDPWGTNYSFTIFNVEPTWTDNTTNFTTINQGDSAQFNTTWYDASGLSHYLFSINQSGSWENTSWIPFSGNVSTNVTNITATQLATVGWRFYANDTFNKVNATDIFLFQVSDIQAPVIYEVNITPSLAYTDDDLYCYVNISDNSGSATVEFTWFVQGLHTTIANDTEVCSNDIICTASVQLPNTAFDKNEEIICSARANDGFLYNNWTNSTPITINNSWPQYSTIANQTWLNNTNNTLNLSTYFTVELQTFQFTLTTVQT